MIKRLSLFLFSVFLCGFIHAQISDWQNPNLRTRQMVITDSVQLDSLAILPNTLQIQIKNGNTLESAQYQFNSESNTLQLNSPISDTIIVTYYVHPQLQRKKIYARNPNLIVDNPTSENLYTVNPVKAQPNAIFDGLQSSGSLVRGITFGNNQDASVQSSLDLQLTGKLSDDVFINAVISDNNVPIEADGYTQNLEQFDQVYVELYNQNSKIRAGHIDLAQTEDYFGKFNRKVTGLQVQTQLKGERGTTTLQASGSISRGEFTQQKFNGMEGNQGPYQLTGNNNETYIIILSGSERIYIDGILLERGQDRDYVINYNTGELTFTTNRLIQSNHRITAEYLYYTNNYNRFTFYGGADHKGEKLNWGIHYFSESDNKNNPVGQSLSNDDLHILADAGNNNDLMVSESGNLTTYDSNKILYRKTQIADNEIYEYSTDSTEELYEVGFTLVGTGNGDYDLATSTANGKVYEYVGESMGSYAPIRRLVAPERTQLLTMRANYDWKPNAGVGLDVGLSNYDPNLYSDIDNSENHGLALRLTGKQQMYSGNFTFRPQINYSFIGQNFNTLQRIRDAEFTREFNLDQEFSESDQHFLEASWNTLYKENTQLNYQLSYLNNKNIYDGIKHTITAEHRTEKTEIRANASLLNTHQTDLSTTFSTYNALIDRKVGKFILGAGTSGEENRYKTNSDALGMESFKWNETYLSAMIGDSAQLYSRLKIYQRKDDSVRLEDLTNYSKSYGLQWENRLIQTAKQRLKFVANYRNVNYSVADSTDVSYVTGNISWYKSFLKKGLILNTRYELGSGTDAQRAFSYVEVTDGTGIYKWIDYNEDGIQQLDEFEIAEFSDEAAYIRVYTGTINYDRTSNNGLTLSAQLIPERFLSETSFWKRWRGVASLSTTKKTLKGDEVALWNPFGEEDHIRLKTQQVRAQITYNKSSGNKWNGSYEFTEQQNRQVVYTGAESNSSTVHTLSVQHRPSENFVAEITQKFNQINRDSEAFESRRYKLNGFELTPAISYLRDSHFKSTLGLTYVKSNNTQGEETLDAKQLNTELQWNDQKKTSFYVSFDYINNQFEGIESSVVGNRMLQGLKSGNNMVWRLLFQRQLNNFLEINVTYDGRKSEENKAIHTGSIQLRARF